MSFNPDLYKAIQSGGLTLSSPSIGIAKNATSELDALSVALDDPSLELMFIDPAILTSTKNAVKAANLSANSSMSHMTTTANNSLQTSSLTKAINTLDAKVDGLPSGCTNTANLFGSIQGESDSDFTELTAFASELIKGLGDFLSGLIDKDELELMMGSISESLGTTVANVESLIKKEVGHLGELINKQQALALSQSIERLFNDDCTKSIMDTVLPPEIKDLL